MSKTNNRKKIKLLIDYIRKFFYSVFANEVLHLERGAEARGEDGR